MGDIVPLHPSMPPRLARQVWKLVHPANPELAAFPVSIDHDPAAAEWARRKQALLEVTAKREDCHDWFVLLCCGINGVTEDTFCQWRREIPQNRRAEIPHFILS